MNTEDVIKYKGQQVRIFLRNNFHYSGYIKSVKNSSIIFYDKFGTEITFEADFVLFIEPVKEKVK